jgi:hypothetical protein
VSELQVKFGEQSSSDCLNMADDNCGSGDEPDSSCLVLEMFFGFMEEDPQGIGTSNCCNGAQTDDPEMISDVTHGSEPRDVLVSKEQYRLLERGS